MPKSLIWITAGLAEVMTPVGTRAPDPGTSNKSWIYRGITPLSVKIIQIQQVITMSMTLKAAVRVFFFGGNGWPESCIN